MTEYIATPEQWAALERWALEKDNACSCILELRARVEALEAAAQKHIVGTNSNIVALFTRVEALEAAERQASKVYEINEPLQLTPEQAQHVRDLLAPSFKPIPTTSQSGSSLVQRVMGVLGHYGPGTARAVIREVAEWLQEEGYPSSPSRLEREVEQ